MNLLGKQPSAVHRSREVPKTMVWKVQACFLHALPFSIGISDLGTAHSAYKHSTIGVYILLTSAR